MKEKRREKIAIRTEKKQARFFPHTHTGKKKKGKKKFSHTSLQQPFIRSWKKNVQNLQIKNLFLDMVNRDFY